MQTDEKKDDPVNHPSHYTAGKIEVIDFLEDQGFPYHLGNAVKYIARAGKKDPEKTIEDLRKAVLVPPLWDSVWKCMHFDANVWKAYKHRFADGFRM